MPESDNELLHRVRQGDTEAFHGLVERYAQYLYRVAYSLVGNAADAEDVLQETFAGAFKSAAGFRQQASVKTWLVRILIRQAARFRRSAGHRPLSMHGAAGEAEAGRLSVPSPSAAVDRRLDVAEVLQTLSLEHREVLVLREFEQLSYEEMAQTLGVPPGTVESRLYRARQALKEKLKGYLS